jgi:D-arabinose 1-dehydrogenase-like Zn-dependent alcohol dehydrogenase
LHDYGLRATDRIGILGIGGLGHLAIQFAAKMGMEVVVFSATESKKQEAFQLGATEFHISKGVTEFKDIEPLDALLITTSTIPDLSV